MSSSVVVGGGISGLTAAILLKKKYDQVFLIEQAEHCGGLLQAVKDDKGNIYDQGTHVPETTGINELDEILFGHSQPSDKLWRKIDKLRTGNYFSGSWDLQTQTIDSRKLNVSEYHIGLGQFMSCDTVSTAEDIETYLIETLGYTFYHELALPIIKKIYGKDVDAKNLTRKTGVNYFGAGRIIALNQELTRLLKTNAIFDAKLGFHCQDEFELHMAEKGSRLPQYFYPKGDVGVQYWVDSLLVQAKDLGVNILNNTNVKQIEHNDGSISSVIVASKTARDGEEQSIPCDLLFWSAPPIFALRAAGIPICTKPSKFKTANLLHYTFDRPVLNNQSHYLWNWDDVSPIFRVTLYQNLRKNNVYQVTVEFLSDADDVNDYDLDDGMKDLIKMNLVSPDAVITSSMKQRINNTFPVPTFSFESATLNQYQTLSQNLSNILVSGRFSGQCWLQADVLRKAYYDIMNVVPD
jgi:protoporphyrinogen oxidase